MESGLSCIVLSNTCSSLASDLSKHKMLAFSPPQTFTMPEVESICMHQRQKFQAELLDDRLPLYSLLQSVLPNAVTKLPSIYHPILNFFYFEQYKSSADVAWAKQIRKYMETINSQLTFLWKIWLQVFRKRKLYTDSCCSFLECSPNVLQWLLASIGEKTVSTESKSKTFYLAPMCMHPVLIVYLLHLQSLWNKCCLYHRTRSYLNHTPPHDIALCLEQVLPNGKDVHTLYLNSIYIPTIQFVDDPMIMNIATLYIACDTANDSFKTVEKLPLTMENLSSVMASWQKMGMKLLLWLPLYNKTKTLHYHIYIESECPFYHSPVSLQDICQHAKRLYVQNETMIWTYPATDYDLMSFVNWYRSCCKEMFPIIQDSLHISRHATTKESDINIYGKQIISIPNMTQFEQRFTKSFRELHVCIVSALRLSQPLPQQAHCFATCNPIDLFEKCMDVG